jgi:hypothetical protein
MPMTVSTLSTNKNRKKPNMVMNHDSCGEKFFFWNLDSSESMCNT